MVFTRKFSEFPYGGAQATGDQPVGLEGGVNTRWDFTGGGGGGSGSVITIINQDTSALDVARWVRFDDATQLYVHGIATTAEFAEIEGVVLNILSPTQFSLQQAGYIPSGTPGFNSFATNGVYFLSDSALGEQTLTVPTTNGYVNKPLFAADSPDSGWVICLMRGMIIGTPGPIPAVTPGGSDTSTHTFSQPGNTFQIADWVRVTGDNVHGLADGTNLQNSQSDGVVIAAGDPNFTVQFSGWNTNTVTTAYDATGVVIPGGIVSGTVYYISDVVPGQLTPTPPTAAGTSNKPLFISASESDGTGWVLPQRPDLNTAGDMNPSIVVVNQPGHGLTRGDVVRVAVANIYVRAQADNAINALPVGFVREVIDADNFILQTSGFCDAFTAPFTPLNPALRYFLSATIPGAITTIEPTGAGQYSVPMLIALNATTGYILEQRPLPGGLAPNSAKYIVQEADAALPNAQSLGTIGTGIVFNTDSGTVGVLSTIPVVPLALGGTETVLANPHADKLFAWDGAGNHAEFLGIGAGLAIVGNDLTATGGGGGSGIIQVKNTLNRTQNVPTVYVVGVNTPIPGLTVTLTPASVTSTFKITVSMNYKSTITSGTTAEFFQLTRNGVGIANDLGIPSGGGDIPVGFAGCQSSSSATSAMLSAQTVFVDSPATAAPVTYGVQIPSTYDVPYTFYLNGWSTGGGFPRYCAVSSIVVEEIGT